MVRKTQSEVIIGGIIERKLFCPKAKTKMSVIDSGSDARAKIKFLTIWYSKPALMSNGKSRSFSASVTSKICLLGVKETPKRNTVGIRCEAKSFAPVRLYA